MLNGIINDAYIAFSPVIKGNGDGKPGEIVGKVCGAVKGINDPDRFFRYRII